MDRTSFREDGNLVMIKTQRRKTDKKRLWVYGKLYLKVQVIEILIRLLM
ncbi:hypothetical protein J15TS10_27130 [Paenibacillus woosongensis]|uniref:Transposase n=1 Tax=Paenibacillus woosongensis TaxID=307580 RepID=A0ABQ4MSL7_9BACL|nr:hypothetical protein J15TS10_27130 [Paenibacillus woosongensis]